MSGASRERAAAERERVEHDAHKPVAPRRRARVALRLADEEQRLEQLDRRRRRQHARVQQRRDEADEPADVHRRVVVERALQLVLRAGRHRRAELVVRRVEQPDERAVHRRLRLQPVHAVEDRVGDQRAVQRQVALQRAREAVPCRERFCTFLSPTLTMRLIRRVSNDSSGRLVVAAAALHRNLERARAESVRRACARVRATLSRRASRRGVMSSRRREPRRPLPSDFLDRAASRAASSARALRHRTHTSHALESPWRRANYLDDACAPIIGLHLSARRVSIARPPDASMFDGRAHRPPQALNFCRSCATAARVAGRHRTQVRAPALQRRQHRRRPRPATFLPRRPARVRSPSSFPVAHSSVRG